MTSSMARTDSDLFNSFKRKIGGRNLCELCYKCWSINTWYAIMSVSHLHPGEPIHEKVDLKKQEKRWRNLIYPLYHKLAWLEWKVYTWEKSRDIVGAKWFFFFFQMNKVTRRCSHSHVSVSVTFAKCIPLPFLLVEQSQISIFYFAESSLMNSFVGFINHQNIGNWRPNHQL